MLPTRLLHLRRLSVADESELWLELLHRLRRIVDEREARALAATILCPEAEAGDLVFGGFVEFAEFLAQFVFADVGAAGVKDVTDALLECDALRNADVCGAEKTLRHCGRLTLKILTRPSACGPGVGSG